MTREILGLPHLSSMDLQLQLKLGVDSIPVVRFGVEVLMQENVCQTGAEIRVGPEVRVQVEDARAEDEEEAVTYISHPIHDPLPLLMISSLLLQESLHGDLGESANWGI